METKICKQCGEELLIDLFYNNPKGGSKGRDSYCKRCRIQYNKDRKDVTNALRREKMRTNFEYRDKILAEKRYSSRKHFKLQMLCRARQRAEKYGLDFNLEKDDIEIPEFCPLLEIPIYPGKKGDYHNSPSLDRIDNSKGYIKGNIRVISMLANSMKNAATKEQLFKFIKNLPQYLNTD